MPLLVSVLGQPRRWQWMQVLWKACLSAPNTCGRLVVALLGGPHLVQGEDGLGTDGALGCRRGAPGAAASGRRLPEFLSDNIYCFGGSSDDI